MNFVAKIIIFFLLLIFMNFCVYLRVYILDSENWSSKAKKNIMIISNMIMIMGSLYLAFFYR